MVRRLPFTIKLLLAYDVIPETMNDYYQFVLGEFIPRAQTLGLHTIEAWHTAYGNRPLRLIVMAVEDELVLARALETESWFSLEERLRAYVYNYERRAVSARSQFQFFNSAEERF